MREPDPDAVSEAAGPLRPAGRNQADMRAFNERLVLTLIRRRGSLARSEIARLTGLTAQTTSVIVRALEQEGLLKSGQRQRGRVGQPTVPYTLDPAGAFFLGAKIGRRSLETVLVDFRGQIVETTIETYDYPTPDGTLRSLLLAVEKHVSHLGRDAERIAGLGLAMPQRLWEWADQIDAPADSMSSWRDANIRAEVARKLSFPVAFQNDATAACGAELAFGNAASDLQDFLYVFVGVFIGGGLVLDRRLITGPNGNAGALGPMPVPGEDGETTQLLDRASLHVLERAVALYGGEDSAEVMLSGEGVADWSAIDEPVSEWIAEAGSAIAHAVVAAASVIDIQAVIIDGAMPPDIRDRLRDSVGKELSRMDTRGIDSPELRCGSLGPLARALGGASLPLFERFLVDESELPPALRRPRSGLT